MANQRNDAPGPGQEEPLQPQPVATPATTANASRLPVILAGIALAVVLGVLGFLAGSNASKKPTATATATVTTPISPTPKAEESKPEVTTPSVAKAEAVCKDGKPASASASGPDARAVAKCGVQPLMAKKPTPATGVGKVPAPIAVAPAQPSADRLADILRKLAEENRLLKSAGGGTVATGPVSTTFAPAPAYAEEGKVYSDSSGNTYERHTAGSRLCRFMVNGEIRKEVFVNHPDPKESKRQCDVLAAQFEASLQPTTPVK